MCEAWIKLWLRGAVPKTDLLRSVQVLVRLSGSNARWLVNFGYAAKIFFAPKRANGVDLILAAA